jgi:hypothetical protein
VIAADSRLFSFHTPPLVILLLPETYNLICEFAGLSYIPVLKDSLVLGYSSFEFLANNVCTLRVYCGIKSVYLLCWLVGLGG